MMNKLIEGTGMTGLRGCVAGGGQEPTSGGFAGRSNQHAHALYLQLWLLSSGIVRRHEGITLTLSPEGVTMQAPSGPA
jgi:hypothetical protein